MNGIARLRSVDAPCCRSSQGETVYTCARTRSPVRAWGSVALAGHAVQFSSPLRPDHCLPLRYRGACGSPCLFCCGGAPLTLRHGSLRSVGVCAYVCVCVCAGQGHDHRGFEGV